MNINKKKIDTSENESEVKNKFLMTMCHELRTPLNASIGFSEILRLEMDGKLNDKQKHYVEIIIQSNRFLLSLIDDIIRLCMAETKIMDLKFEKVSLPLTLEEVLAVLKDQAEQQNVQIKIESDPQIEFIDADKQKFKQILLNLLSNALKFSKQNGGTVLITSKLEGDMVTISVSDTGIGIKKEKINRLFHKFEQLDSGPARKYGGLGLGLAITKHLVELHGGNISVKSIYNSGTTFTFSVPLRQLSRKYSGNN